MSRILKSSQIIIDENEFRLIPKEILNSNNSNESEKEEQENKRDRIEESKVISKEIIEKAKIEAENIIADAYEQSKQIMEQSRNEGYEEGKLQGFNEGKELADSIINEALAIKKDVQILKEQTLSDLEKEVVTLVINTIEKILNKKTEEDYDTIFNLIQIGLKKCAFTDNLILRVSPEDYDVAVSSKDKILALSENIQDIIIKQDNSLVKGSCILDTSSGSIDSSIKTQFKNAKAIFEELLKSE